MIEINEELTIPESEIRLTATRSSGPGGQNVNKVSSRITLEFDVAHSPSLSDEQREKILARLKNRISNDGVLQISAQAFRTQLANREAAMLRFGELLRDALKERKRRKKTRKPKAAVEQRLEAKKRRGGIKKERSSGWKA
ncbi:MAG: alternative ribosome rescue aminoacyl-tRNA hydrolase ArfB [Thermoanaerobaculia bacterium]